MKYTNKNSIKHIKKQTKKNTNKHIINILTLVKDYYKEKNDKIRVNSYEKAIYQISKFIKPIMKGSELAHLDGIGKGMVEKIDTIISSGTLPILNDIQKIKNNSNNTNSNTNTNTKLNTLLGFSNTFVTKLINNYNTRTINNVKQLVNNNKLKLTKIQTLGVNYYKDLQSLIPRDEITKLTTIFKNIINNTNYTMLVSGSYPSNTKHYSKDIDILIVKHKKLKDNISSGELKNIINKIKIYFEELNKDKENYKENYKENNLESISLGSKKFMGLIKSPISNKMRHIDIRLVTMNELPYSYLYYSSGKIFNKIIREKFKKKGYKLNEYGLYKIRDNKGFEKIKFDEEMNLNLDNIKNREINLLNYIKKIEEEIFKLASMDYKTVQERY